MSVSQDIIVLRDIMTSGIVPINNTEIESTRLPLS